MGIAAISYDDFEMYQGRINPLYQVGKVKEFTVEYFPMLCWITTKTVSKEGKEYIHGFYLDGQRMSDMHALEVHRNPSKFV